MRTLNSHLTSYSHLKKFRPHRVEPSFCLFPSVRQLNVHNALYACTNVQQRRYDVLFIYDMHIAYVRYVINSIIMPIICISDGPFKVVCTCTRYLRSYILVCMYLICIWHAHLSDTNVQSVAAVIHDTSVCVSARICTHEMEAKHSRDQINVCRVYRNPEKTKW